MLDCDKRQYSILASLRAKLLKFENLFVIKLISRWPTIKFLG